MGITFTIEDILEGGSIMKNILSVRSIVCGVVLLCIGASAISAYTAEPSTVQSLGRGTLYVGGSGPSNYTSIQEAIDNSTNGDTIFVYNGTYNENIDTKLKKISLVGEDRDITIIDGQASTPTVKLTTTGVSISGFTVIGTAPEAGITVISLAENILISDNIIKDGGYGIELLITTSKVTITGNTIRNNVYAGIRIQTSTYNIISFNQIEDNGGPGIDLALGSSYNSILNNTITGNGEEGILLQGLASTENTIEGNIINDNNIGIRFNSAGSNPVKWNNIQGNAMEGLLIQASSENTIEQNNFIDNRRQATFKLFASRNTWDANYWSNWIGLKLSAPLFQKFPKAIVGGLRINFDRNPAAVPYNISTSI
jgi:nitrous oxidase accessory protein